MYVHNSSTSYILPRTIDGLFISFEILSILLIVVVGEIANNLDMLLMPQPSFSNDTRLLFTSFLYALYK